VLLAADYPFFDLFWTMIIFFFWVIWIWMLIVILSDVFRRRDIGGGKKAVWCIFIILLPFIGVLSYLFANSDGMAERRMRDVQTAQAQMDDRIRSVAGGGGGGGPASEIENAKRLLDSGAITQEEFEAIKAKALA
jgi:N-methylhydantoinase B/oxoprolinase/acetone carboxylase alpha subunit